MEEKLSHEESLKLINTMINKARNSYHDTGIGPILWGCVISVCALVTFFQVRYHFELPVDIWWLTLVAVIPQIWIGARQKKMLQATPYDEVAMDYLWTCFGIGIAILIFINLSIYSQVAALRSEMEKLTGIPPAFRFSNYSTSYFLLWYGFPTIVTAGFRKFKPMLLGGIFCWVSAVVAIFTSIEIDMLLTAASAILAWLIPGIILWKGYCKRKAANV
jgi:hypothetical protein